MKGQVCVVHTAGGETGCFPPLPCGPDAGDEEGTSLRGIEAGCFSKCIARLLLAEKVSSRRDVLVLSKTQTDHQ